MMLFIRELNAAFNQWKSESQPTDSVSYFHYRNKKAEYRQALRNFIVDKENGKIATLCDTLGVNEKQFWQMIKPKSALSSLIRCAYDYCCKWRYEYHNEKSGIVVFGETPAMHGRMINTRKFFIGSSLIEEVKEYTNLGNYKNYCGSFATNIDENITKASKKAGMLFSARFDRRRTNPLVYLKIWRQACIPCLLFG